MDGKRKWLIPLILIISVIGSALLTVIVSGNELSFVVDSAVVKEHVYLIDDDGSKVRIIKSDRDGSVLDEIEEDKISKGKSLAFDYLTEDDGTVYVYRLEREIESNKVQSEKVFRCNFSKGKLEEVWNLPVTDKESQNNFSISVRDGVLTWFIASADQKEFLARAILYSMDQESKKPSGLALVEYDIGIGFTDFFYGDNGEIVFTTPNGDILKAERGRDPGRMLLNTIQDSDFEMEPPLSDEAEIPAVDVEEVAQSQLEEPDLSDLDATVSGIPVYHGVPLYPDPTGLEKTRLTNFTSDGKHTIYFMDLDREETIAVNLSTGEETTAVPSFRSLKQPDGTKIQPYDFKNLRYTDSGDFSATISRGSNNGVLGIYEDGELTVLDELNPDLSKQLLRGVLFFLGFLAAFLILYLLRGVFLTLTGGKFPIVTKAIALCVPVIIVSILILQHLISSMFVDQMVDRQYKELFLISKQQAQGISEQLLSEIDLSHPYDDVYYYELRQMMTALPAESVIRGGGAAGSGVQEVYDFGYHWLYRMEGSSLVSVFCDQNYINIPIDYYYDRETTELFYRAARDKEVLRGEFRDVGGEWIILAIPVVNDNGRVIAVMETGVTKASLTQAVDEATRKINLVNLVILLILVILLSGLLLFSLAPLKDLRQSVLDILHGKLGVQTYVRGNDEVSEIGAVFNQMSSSIEYHVNELKGLNEGYYKFVPSKIFTMLRKSSVIDVKLGDQISEEITILSFNTVGFEEMASSMNARQMFPLINRTLSELVPVVNQNGGVVDRFENAGLVAFYTGSSEAALTTAITVCQKVDQVNENGGFGDGLTLEMTSGISRGPVMIGIVGQEQRMAATTISEHTNLSAFLRKTAPKYACRVLITEQAAREIPGFEERFNARFLGFLRVTADQSVEKLYDVYDGDPQEIKQRKSMTKSLFEKGVGLYCEKEFYEARLVFIEVLKQFRQDAAAKEYLYRCDQYYQMENPGDVSVFIEEY